MFFASLKKQQKIKLILTFLSVVIIGVTYLFISCSVMNKEKYAEEEYWRNEFAATSAQTKLNLKHRQTATVVTTGTYIENINDLSLKAGSFKIRFYVWFRWQGDPDLDIANRFRVCKGTLSKPEIIKNYRKDNVNYQLLRCEAIIYDMFWTMIFPLDSHQLFMYIEPDYTADKVILKADVKNSGIDPKLTLAGYQIKDFKVTSKILSDDATKGDPEIGNKLEISEMVTGVQIGREGFGLYVKCFIALFGTLTWVLIVLFINVHHKVDPLSMIPAAFFGTVSNIMIGAQLLPDALNLGLLEFVNLWGIISILTITFTVINVNKIRNQEDDKYFAEVYGKVMFYTLLTLVISGNILLPLSASFVF